jgi:hypothetical protein
VLGQPGNVLCRYEDMAEFEDAMGGSFKDFIEKFPIIDLKEDDRFTGGYTFRVRLRHRRHVLLSAPACHGTGQRRCQACLDKMSACEQRLSSASFCYFAFAQRISCIAGRCPGWGWCHIIAGEARPADGRVGANKARSESQNRRGSVAHLPQVKVGPHLRAVPGV